jgi:hypothetical protein
VEINWFKRTMAVVSGYIFRNALISESDCVYTSNVKIPINVALYYYIYTMQFKFLIGGVAVQMDDVILTL